MIKESGQKQRILYLDILRAIAIISISLNHAVNRAFAVQEGQAAETAMLPVYLNVIKTGTAVFSRIGVPLFLMITGSLMLTRTYNTDKEIRKFYKSNWLNLFITAEIWFFIMFAIIMVISAPDMFRLASLPKLLLRCILNQLFVSQKTLGSMWYMQIIIPMYMLLPVFSLFLHKGFDKWLIPLTGIIIYTQYLIPAVSAFFKMNEIPFAVHTDFGGEGIVHYLFVYVLAGYWIHKYRERIREHVRIRNMAIIWILLFAAVSAYQFYAFQKEMDYVLRYNSPGVALCGVGLFILVLLVKDVPGFMRKPIEYLSKISFGIYFVHIIIMEMLVRVSPVLSDSWNPALLMLFYEVVSVGVSVLFIEILSKNHFCKKYMFMIKP